MALATRHVMNLSWHLHKPLYRKKHVPSNYVVILKLLSEATHHPLQAKETPSHQMKYEIAKLHLKLNATALHIVECAMYMRRASLMKLYLQLTFANQALSSTNFQRLNLLALSILHK